jgi:DNA-binding NarL/FixJ family response regulator
MTPEQARIVLIEDHAILREGLRALIELEADLKVVGEAGDGAEGLRVVQATTPALVITDLAMPGGSGLRTIRELRSACASLRVLVLTAHCTDEHIGAALAAGADGYVLKDANRTELLQAIRSVIGGQKFFSESVSTRLVSGYLRRNARPSEACAKITLREREILTRIALGEYNKRIPLALRLSVQTVTGDMPMNGSSASHLSAFRAANGICPAVISTGLRLSRPSGKQLSGGN